MRPRVAVVVYNPVVAAATGTRLIERCGFADPRQLAREYVADLAEVSGGYLQYEIVDWAEAESLPPLIDGFPYSGPAWLEHWQRGGIRTGGPRAH